MTLKLHLPPELEQRLIQEAKRQALPLDAYTLELLDTPATQRPAPGTRDPARHMHC
jgi:hypothetical protein